MIYSNGLVTHGGKKISRKLYKTFNMARSGMTSSRPACNRRPGSWTIFQFKFKSMFVPGNKVVGTPATLFFIILGKTLKLFETRMVKN
jgi:hypothetical protein